MKRWNPKSLWVGLVALFVIGSPEISLACSVCSGGREDENRMAFILTTAFLTFLPLSIIGGLAWYLRRRFLQLEAEASRQQPVGLRT